MSQPRSLRRDLALGLGLSVVGLWLIAMMGSWVVLRQEINEIYDAALRRAADRILQLPPSVSPAPSEPPSRTPEDMSYMVRTADGTVLLRSPGADPAVFGDVPRKGFHESAGHRVYGRDTGQGSILQISDPIDERGDATLDALVTLLVPATVLVPLIFFVVAGFISRRLRPVARMAAQVAERDSSDLRPLSTPGLQVELLPIHDAVNRLMGRLANALAAERAFSANAAHELRTPIAATLAHTQRLIAQAPEGPLRARARTIETELKRMARLSEKLLDLARADAAGVPSGSPQDLRTVLSLVAEDFRGEADMRVTLPDVPVLAPIDPDAFGILARNLIENAVVHGAPPVEVDLQANGRLQVTNGGPVLAPATLTLLTRRFERLGSRRQGSGLGLAIVAALVHNANAKLELLSPAPGRADGLAAIVTLPRARRETS